MLRLFLLWRPFRRLPASAPCVFAPARCDRIVCIWLPSCRGIVSAIATSAELLDQPLEDPPPDLRVRHLAPAEEDRRLDLVAVREEALDVLLLELVVVLVDLRAGT